jgi:DNA-binding LytR/AlgR family response regulator
VIAVLRRSTTGSRSPAFLVLFYVGVGLLSVLLWATLTGFGIALWWSFPSLIPDQLLWHTGFELQHKTVLAALVFALIAIASPPRHAPLIEQPREPTPAVRPPPVLALRTPQRLVFVAPAEIDWLGADRDHVVVHARGGIHRVRGRLSNFEKRLPSERFIRVSRSAIVNVEAITELQPWFRGDFIVLLRNGDKVQTGRTCRDRITRLIP